MNQTNYQRTAAWLEAAGKQPHNAEHLSVQIGCHLEEMVEQLELIRTNDIGAQASIDSALVELRAVAIFFKTGASLAYIPQSLRTDFLKELCDGKVTADGVAYQLGADMDEADKRVIYANWSKFDKDGKPVLLPGGKLGKSELYKKADLKGLV